MEENMKNEQFICGIYQNTSTAIQSINDLYGKVKSANLKKLLKKHEAGYKDIKCQCEQLAHKLEIDLKDNNFFEKARLWTSINIGTITDNSARHLGEMMIIGTVMGIVNCYKLMSENKRANKEIYNLCSLLAKTEEDFFEELKSYLKAFA